MSFFTPDTTLLNSFEERGRFVMVWRLSILFTVVFTILAIVLSATSDAATYIYGIIVALSISMLIYLHYSRKSVPVFWIYAISASILSQFTLNTLLDSAHHSDLIWVLSTIIFTFVGIGRKAGIALLIFHSIGLGYYITFNLNTHYDVVHHYSTTQKIALFTEVSLGLTTIAYLLNQYLVFQSYSRNQLKMLNESLEQQNEMILVKNRENITLVKEVHHRVKNNLQIIISLLRMQRSEIQSQDTRDQFNIAINRILTMSMIHQKLYQEKEPSKINVRDYLDDLIHELVSLSDRRTPVQVKMEASEEFADLKTIVPFGLLVNELVANSLKHAFKSDDSNEINIQLKSEKKNSFEFYYEDNGQWLEPKENESGFGLELIDILTEQLEGSYSREGSSYRFIIQQDANA